MPEVNKVEPDRQRALRPAPPAPPPPPPPATRAPAPAPTPAAPPPADTVAIGPQEPEQGDSNALAAGLAANYPAPQGHVAPTPPPPPPEDRGEKAIGPPHPPGTPHP